MTTKRAVNAVGQRLTDASQHLPRPHNYRTKQASSRKGGTEEGMKRYALLVTGNAGQRLTVSTGSVYSRVRGKTSH